MAPFDSHFSRENFDFPFSQTPADEANYRLECARVSSDLTAYFDGEADREQADAAHHHLTTCAACAKMWRSWGDTRFLWRGAHTPLPPADLAARIRQSCYLHALTGFPADAETVQNNLPPNLQADILARTTRRETPHSETACPEVTSASTCSVASAAITMETRVASSRWMWSRATAGAVPALAVWLLFVTNFGAVPTAPVTKHDSVSTPAVSSMLKAAKVSVRRKTARALRVAVAPRAIAVPAIEHTEPERAREMETVESEPVSRRASVEEFKAVAPSPVRFEFAAMTPTSVRRNWENSPVDEIEAVVPAPKIVAAPVAKVVVPRVSMTRATENVTTSRRARRVLSRPLLSRVSAPPTALMTVALQPVDSREESGEDLSAREEIAAHSTLAEVHDVGDVRPDEVRNVVDAYAEVWEEEGT